MPPLHFSVRIRKFCPRSVPRVRVLLILVFSLFVLAPEKIDPWIASAEVINFLNHLRLLEIGSIDLVDSSSQLGAALV